PIAGVTTPFHLTGFWTRTTSGAAATPPSALIATLTTVTLTFGATIGTPPVGVKASSISSAPSAALGAVPVTVTTLSSWGSGVSVTFAVPVQRHAPGVPVGVIAALSLT